MRYKATHVAQCGLVGMMAIGTVMAQSDVQSDGAVPNIVAALEWDSRHVSEGRDNLDGDSLAGIAVEADVGNLTLGLWYADSPGQRYREANAYIHYGLVWRDLEGYVAYNHLRFLADDEHDNEISTGIAYTHLPLNSTIGLDATWSFDAEGAFGEVSLGSEFQLFEWLTLRPSATLGFNAGFIADGHDGANHGGVRLEAAVPINRLFELTGYVAGTWAIDADPARYPDDAQLKNVMYGGISLQFSRH